MILLDTSGLLALHHAYEIRHEAARTLFEAAGPELVHSYVLAEFIALADARRLPRASALAFAESLVEQPDVEAVWVGEELHREAMKFPYPPARQAVFPGRRCELSSHRASRDHRGTYH